MEWRWAQWSTGWAWLEPVLGVATLLALLSGIRTGLRMRLVRARRSPVPAFVRRLIALLGLGLALFASPSSASGRTTAHPGREQRPLLEAPWRGTSGFPPPLPLVPSGSPTIESPEAHPAIHKGSVRVPGPLFERVTRPRGRQRDGSRHLHPAGNPRSVDLERASSVTVRDGDCLWTIAAEILDSDDPQRVDAYWRALFHLNRDVIGDDPNRLLPGQVLRLPGRTR